MTDRDLLDEAARDVLRRNDRGGYTVPSARLYPFQWNWDSAFAAWGWVAFGVPTEDPVSPAFEPRRYWRGPTWPVVSSLVALGLADQGRTLESERLRRETATLIERGGFAEYFDPIDGTPCGGGSFTWTAAVWLAWARRVGSTVRS